MPNMRFRRSVQSSDSAPTPPSRRLDATSLEQAMWGWWLLPTRLLLRALNTKQTRNPTNSCSEILWIHLPESTGNRENGGRERKRAPGCGFAGGGESTEEGTGKSARVSPLSTNSRREKTKTPETVFPTFMLQRLLVCERLVEELSPLAKPSTFFSGPKGPHNTRQRTDGSSPQPVSVSSPGCASIPLILSPFPRLRNAMESGSRSPLPAIARCKQR